MTGVGPWLYVKEKHGYFRRHRNWPGSTRWEPVVAPDGEHVPDPPATPRRTRVSVSKPPKVRRP